jgi:hypothetical protein
VVAILAVAVLGVVVGVVVRAPVSMDELEEGDFTGALLGAVTGVDSKFDRFVVNVPRPPLVADASMVIIVTRRQDVTASVTILGKRCVVLPLRNRLILPLLM